MILYQCQRQGDKYRNYPLPLGCVYGRDDASPFVCLLEYAMEEKTGLRASVRLFRLDMQGRRGWYEVWETSVTTRAIINYVNNDSPLRKKFVPITRYGTSNKLAEVPRKHGHVRIYA